MASAMEQQPSLSFGRQEEQGFNLREWAQKAHISRENTNSRRFSASNIRSFREETRSFKSNATIPSAASSPGYTLIDEIDPSTYSFTTALRALQARSGYGWECISLDGFALNSKWNEAEKYICNPLSGEVPIECLSSKTLSGRSISTLARRITMSGPLGYSSHARLIQTKTNIKTQEEDTESPIQEKKVESLKKDVGTQSTPNIFSRSPSPTSTPPIKERSLELCKDGGESPNSATKSKSEEEEIEEIEKTEKEEKQVRRKDKQMCKCRQVGCLSWMRKWQRVKQKPSWKVCLDRGI